MTDSERLEVMIRHVGRAQQLLASFAASTGPEAGLPLDDFLRGLRQELAHWELAAAMREGSDAAKKESEAA
jgi:hypothetical protein